MTRERHMRLVPAEAEPLGRPGYAWFVGSLAGLPVTDLLTILSESLRTGELWIATGARERTVWLRDGRVVFAASTDPADRLGAVLWRHGLLSADEVERAGRRIAPGVPLGQVLVQDGLLTPAALYDAVVAQVRDIVLAAFHEPDGVFRFHEGEAPPGGQAAPLPERTRDLVIAGVRTVLEVQELLPLVPDPDRAVQVRDAPAAGLDARAARLLAALATARSAREAFHATELGFREGIRVLAALAQADLVSGPVAPAPLPAAEAGASADEEPARGAGPLETYRRLLKRVFFRIAHATPDAAARLNSWFDRLPPGDRAAFDGVRVSPDGDVDVPRVLVNVFASGGSEGPAARARALALLDALLGFALFEAKNLLASGDAASLSDEIARARGRVHP